MPADGCISATMVAHKAERTDPLAAAFVVPGQEKGAVLINRVPRTDAIRVGMDGEVTMTDGIPVAPRP